MNSILRLFFGEDPGLESPNSFLMIFSRSGLTSESRNLPFSLSALINFSNADCNEKPSEREFQKRVIVSDACVYV